MEIHLINVDNKYRVQIYVYKLKNVFKEQGMDTDFDAYLCCTFNVYVALYLYMGII